MQRYLRQELELNVSSRRVPVPVSGPGPARYVAPPVSRARRSRQAGRQAPVPSTAWRACGTVVCVRACVRACMTSPREPMVERRAVGGWAGASRCRRRQTRGWLGGLPVTVVVDDYPALQPEKVLSWVGRYEHGACLSSPAQSSQVQLVPSSLPSLARARETYRRHRLERSLLHLTQYPLSAACCPPEHTLLQLPASLRAPAVLPGVMLAPCRRTA